MKDIKYLHIANNFKSIVSINNNIVININSEDNNYTTIQTNNDNLYISYTPYSTSKGSYLPYAEKLNLSNISLNNNLKVIPFRNNHFEIYFNNLEVPNISPSEIISEEYFGKINIVILNNSSGNILFYENNKLKKQLTTYKITSAEISQIKNKITIKCLTQNDTYYIAILNIENLEILQEILCDSFEENNNEIKTLTRLNDFAFHGKINSFNFENGIVDDYIVYINGKPETTDSFLLIPYAFLDAIKVGNYNLARTYLSHNLSTASDSHLESYFGKIEEIFLDSYNLENFKIPYVIKNEIGFEFVDFIVEENKIIEILK